MDRERHGSIAKTGTWAAQEISEKMGVSKPAWMLSRNKPEWGYAFFVPPKRPYGESHHKLEIMPSSRAIHMTAPNVEVTIDNALAPRLTRDGIMVDTADGNARALFLRDGHIAVEVFPHPKAQPLEPAPTAGEPQDDAIPDSSTISSPRASGDETEASTDVSAAE
jgi:hypothetical protein